MELAEFGGWFASGRFDLTWSMAQLLEVLRLVGKAEPDHLIVERLAEVSDIMPGQAVEALRLLVEGDREGWLLLGYHGHARTILTNAIQGSVQEAREDAIAFINWLAARGVREFLDLVPREERNGQT